MTRYLSASPFNVYSPSGKEYRDNYDAIDWGKSKATPSPAGEFLVRKFEEAVVGDTVQSMVRQFHETFNVPIATKLNVPLDDRLKLRLKLVAEEFFELLAACEVYPECMCGGSVSDIVDRYIDNDLGSVNLIEVADALADIAYVVEGFNLEAGIDSARVLAEVHFSNMSKLGEDGKPVYREDGKVIKGPGYTPPDISRVLGF